MNFWKFVVFTAVFFNFIYSNNIDSLLSVLEKGGASNKTELLLKISEYYEKKKPRSAILYANELLSISTNTMEKAYAYKVLGTAYLLLKKPDSTIFFYNKALDLLKSKQVSDKELQYKLYSNLGVAYKIKGEYVKSLQSLLKAIHIANEVGDEKLIADAYANIGTTYLKQGNIPKSIDYLLKALSKYEEVKDTSKILKTYLNLANVYLQYKDYDKALEYYKKTLKLNETLPNENIEMKAKAYFGLGKTYRFLYNKDKNEDYINNSIEYFKEAARLYPPLKASSYKEIAIIYIGLKDFDTALEYAMQSLKIDEQRKIIPSLAQDYFIVGSILFNKGKLKEAEKYLKKAETIGKKLNNKGLLKDIYAYLASVYYELKDYKKAVNYLEAQNRILQDISSSEVGKIVAKYEAQYEIEKKEREFQLWQIQEEAKRKRQKIIIIAMVGGLALLLVITFLIYRSLRHTKLTNEIISQQNLLLERQKKDLEEKNNAILESITYAQRIQRALLSQSYDYLTSSFKEHFLIFKPKDILSGDFYWVYAPNNRYVVFAVGDCTGHGVPAALVGVLSIELLNEIIIEQKIIQPNKVLELLRERIMQTLGHKPERYSQKDGLDLSLCVWDKEECVLYFSGAYNPIYIIRKVENTNEQLKIEKFIQNPLTLKKNVIKTVIEDNYLLTEIKGDSQPIGIHHREPLPFSYFKIHIKSDDRIYLFSDGFADQFGGKNKRKFTYGRFKRLILSVQDKSLPAQKEFIEEVLNKWMQGMEQMDDITILGVKI